ncbi:MAG: tetratricopeptide repeat protein [Syntrophobacteria bacterium]
MKLSQKTLLLWAGLIVLLTLLAYIPAMRGGYIWDDNAHITDNAALRSSDGLASIWFNPKVLPQYYPLVHTTFWVEYRLWQLHPFGYHLVNVLLHAINAILLLLVLRYLRVPGAWLAAAFFALHPVHVESVAWITERKNVLSGFFYLSSALAYLRFANVTGDPANTSLSSDIHPLTSGKSSRSWGFYAFSLFLFLCALLSKTVTCSLPAAILLVLWWKRGRICRRDILTLIPYFVVGALFGLTTVWLEKYQVGAYGGEWALSFLDRCLVAGRALWFYAGKLLWPHSLTFIYPRWHIEAGVWWQYLFPATALAVISILWVMRRRIGKGPFVAVAFFAGTLVPALGFFDVYPMRFSFVADHFQYLASIGLIALAAASMTAFLGRLGPRQSTIGFVVCMAVLFFFGVLVWKQSTIYGDAETLYRDTISKNPHAWMAHYNLGVLLVNSGRSDEVMAHFSEALRLQPDDADAHYNLGVALEKQGRLKEAMAHFSEAVRLRPDYADTHYSMAVILARQNKFKEAISHYSNALRVNPTYAEAHNNLGVALFSLGELNKAIEHYRTALKLDPNFGKAHNNLGNALIQKGKLDEAIAHYSRALEIRAHYPEAHNNLGVALARQGKIDAAIVQFEKALQLKPDYAQARANLVLALETASKIREPSKSSSAP